jgi:branched-chain amino acid transport system substrate-binding protein
LGRARPRHRGRWAAAAVAAAAAITLAGCGSSSGSGSSGGTITFGQLLPFTGAKAELSTWATHGDAAATYDVNSAGGVMGKKLKVVSADTSGDAVDAVPALRKLLISSPAFIVGPFSLTAMAVINQFSSNHVVDYVIGGTTQLDHMSQKYVYRTTASDSAEVVAMAYYAIHHGYTRAAYIFDNSSNTQGLVQPTRPSFPTRAPTVPTSRPPSPSTPRSSSRRSTSRRPPPCSRTCASSVT